MNADQITQKVAATLKLGMEKGFALPLFLATVDRYGSMYLARYDEEDGHLTATVLAENLEATMLRLPLNMMLTDSSGNGLHVLVGRESH